MHEDGSSNNFSVLFMIKKGRALQKKTEGGIQEALLWKF